MIHNNEKSKFNKDLWWEIEEYLGDVTDVEIVPIPEGDSKYLKFQLNYKSNGVQKSDYYQNFKPLIAAMLYVGELNSPIKKFKNSI